MKLYRIIIILFLLTAFACSREAGNGKSNEALSKAEYIEKMKQYNNEENFREAQSILNSYREQFGTYAGIEELASIIHSNIGGQLIVQNGYDSAFIYLKEANSIYPGNKRALKLLAKMYAMADMLDTAKLFIDRALCIDSMDAEMYLIRGNIEFLRNRGMSAQNAYIKAIHIDTTYDEAYLNLGILYYETESYAYALKMFKESVRYDSLNIAAYDYIISIYANAGIPDSSLRYAKIFERKKMELMEDSVQ